MTNLESVLKSRDITLPTKVHIVKAMVFPSASYGFPISVDGKEFACNAGDQDLIPRLGRYPGEGNGYPLQDSCLENSMDRSWDHKESDTTEH